MVSALLLLFAFGSPRVQLLVARVLEVLLVPPDSDDNLSSAIAPADASAAPISAPTSTSAAVHAIPNLAPVCVSALVRSVGPALCPMPGLLLLVRPSRWPDGTVAVSEWMAANPHPLAPPAERTGLYHVFVHHVEGLSTQTMVKTLIKANGVSERIARSQAYSLERSAFWIGRGPWLFYGMRSQPWPIEGHFGISVPYNIFCATQARTPARILGEATRSLR